ncbi:MAG: FG-GAP repeat domain-containing protein [Opitutales bacterium]
MASAGLLSLAAGCRPEPGRETHSEERLEASSPSVLDESFLRPREIGRPMEGQPWITDLLIADLDQDGLKDVLVAEGRRHEVSWIRQVRPGVYEETVLAAGIRAPAHLATADMDGDGDLDILVASMGMIMPSNEKIGAVILLENDGQEQFTARTLLEDVSRVTDVRAGDLDQDGDLDLVIGQFGYHEGEIQRLENLGNGEFRAHPLLGLSGTIHTPIADLDGDGDLDFIALVSQNWEEVYAFINNGQGAFQSRVLWGSTNQDYGSSGLRLADLDGDEDLDILFTNGDGFDYATPGDRPWHGVQWLQNHDGQRFTFHRIGDFAGAYSPLAIDLDGDGDQDVVAVSGFNDWSDPQAASLVCFENDGQQRFTRRVLARAPTHLIVVDGADMDNDGAPELVTGGVYFYPPFDRMARVLLWERHAP